MAIEIYKYTQIIGANVHIQHYLNLLYSQPYSLPSIQVLLMKALSGMALICSPLTACCLRSY